MVFQLEILYSFLLLLSCAIGISINIGHVEFFQRVQKIYHLGLEMFS